MTQIASETANTGIANSIAHTLRSIATNPKVVAFTNSTAGKVMSYILNASYFKNNFGLCASFLLVKTVIDYIRPPVVKNHHGRPMFTPTGKVRRYNPNRRWALFSIATIGTAYLSRTALKVAFTSLPIVLQHTLRFSGMILQLVVLCKIAKTLVYSPKAPSHKGPSPMGRRIQPDIAELQRRKKEAEARRNYYRIQAWTIGKPTFQKINQLYQTLSTMTGHSRIIKFVGDEISPAEALIVQTVTQHRKEVLRNADETDGPVLRGMYEQFDIMPLTTPEEWRRAQTYYTETVQPKEREITIKSQETTRQAEMLAKVDEADETRVAIEPLYVQYNALFTVGHTQEEREQFYAAHLDALEKEINRKHAEAEESSSSSSDEDEPVPQLVPEPVVDHTQAKAQVSEHKGAPRDLLAPPEQDAHSARSSRSNSVNPETTSARALENICAQILQALGTSPVRENLPKVLIATADLLGELATNIETIREAPQTFCNSVDLHEAFQEEAQGVIESVRQTEQEARKNANDMQICLTPPEEPTPAETGILTLGIGKVAKAANELRGTIDQLVNERYTPYAARIRALV